MRVYVPILDNSRIEVLEIVAMLRAGTGNVTITGPITQEIENVYARAVELSYSLSDLGEFPEPQLNDHDLHIRFKCSTSDAPIGGESYGLGLFVCLAGLFSGRSPQVGDGFTGILGESGEVLAVDEIESKRLGAPTVGITRLFLPGGQLSFFCRSVNQCPVQSVFECWSVLRYESPLLPILQGADLAQG